LKGAAVLMFQVVVPATVLAQVWRPGPRSARLARLVEGSEVDALDEKRAREVGELLGLRDADDIADAHVVCCATAHRAAVVTSDPRDIEALAGPGEGLSVIRV